MRSHFIKTLIQIAEKDGRVVLLSGDLGFGVLEEFIAQFPKRFYNVGVAEQNMVGVAMGLAEAGLLPFCYSIASFMTMRPYEFIRTASLQRLPIRLIGTGPGFTYSHLGPTHYSIEDIALMRCQPGITSIISADYKQAQLALKATYDLPQPIYYRLYKDGGNLIASLGSDFDLSKAYEITKGKKTLLISMGAASVEALGAVKKFKNKIGHIIVSNFNPGPDQFLISKIKQYQQVITVEDHFINGGLGSYVAELIAENNLQVPLVRLGVKQPLSSISGEQKFMHAQHGFSAEDICRHVQ